MGIEELFENCLKFMTEHLNTVDVPVIALYRPYIMTTSTI